MFQKACKWLIYRNVNFCLNIVTTARNKLPAQIHSDASTYWLILLDSNPWNFLWQTLKHLKRYETNFQRDSNHRGFCTSVSAWWRRHKDKLCDRKLTGFLRLLRLFPILKGSDNFQQVVFRARQLFLLWRSPTTEAPERELTPSSSLQQIVVTLFNFHEKLLL